MTDNAPSRPFPPETERQVAELAAMRRMLEASRGTFSLSITICNSPPLRDYLIERLKSDHEGIEVVRLHDLTEDVYATVCEAGQDGDRSALLLVNLEKSLPSAADEHPILRGLNATRELWKRNYPCPVVFWLPEYAATLLSEHARDLWAWRSHQFEFVSELAEPTAALQADRFAGDVSAAADLDADQKRFRIAELEQRVAEAGEPPPDELAPHVVVWLNELGVLWKVLGELDHSESVHCKALKIAEKLGLAAGTADQYGNLGLIYQARGDLDRAEQMLRKSLEIEEKLGRLEGMAADYGNLGIVLRIRGDLDRAEQMQRKALDINEKLGRVEGMAFDYGNLGSVMRIRGDLDRAEQMQRKALDIYEKLGRVKGMAVQYNNLGVIYQTRGDLGRAEQLYRKSLEIHEKLGILEEVAANCANLGSVYEARGDPAQARRNWAKARKLYIKIGMPYMVEEVQGWLDDLADDDAGERPASS